MKETTSDIMQVGNLENVAKHLQLSLVCRKHFASRLLTHTLTHTQSKYHNPLVHEDYERAPH